MNTLERLYIEDIINSLKTGIRIIDKDFNIIYINKAYAEMLGVTERSINGIKCYEISYNPKCYNSGCPLKLILNGERYVISEIETPLSNMELFCYPIKNSDGEIIGIVEEAKDITEFKRIEKDLKIRDAILASSVNAIAVADLNGRIIYVNEAFLKLWECNEEDILHRSINDFWQTSDQPTDILALLQVKGKWISERMAERKDGSLFYTQILSSMVLDENGIPICIVTSFIDITEFKKVKEGKIRAQLALAVAKTNTDTIKSIMDAVVIAIAITDIEGKIIRFNRGFVETLKLSDDNDVINKQPTDFIKKDDVPKINDALRKCLKDGYAGGIECTAITGDGLEITVIIDLTLMKDIKGNPTGVILVMRDITERKKSQKALEHLSNELISKNKELEQVIYVTSHDLRSPLVNIQGFSRELEQSFNQIRYIINENSSLPCMKEISNILDNDISESLKFITASTSKMDLLISGLLRLSRLGRTTLNIKKLDMNKLISNVSANFEFQIKKGQIDLIIDDLPSCYGDENQINQVFSNLLGNAIKYLDPNRKGIIKIYGWNDNIKTIYCIEDNGIGIDKEYHNKIYNLFYRINPKDSSGEGLGLTIVKKILERHDGDIWLESQKNNGSKFFVSLPNIYKEM
ncbi:MAG: PAS domain-containing sensor histidine kinase [bacterium]